MTHDADAHPPHAFADALESRRVGDSRFAKAYGATGDHGRSIIKTCIAGLYQAGQRRSLASSSFTEQFHGGESRTEQRANRPWFALLLDPSVVAPAQVLAALMPAICRRIPLVAVIRPRAKTGWPSPVLTALELCGVELVLEPSQRDLGQCLKVLGSLHGPGGVACLGMSPFWERVRSMAESVGQVHWLCPPDRVGLLAASGITWNRETLAVSHAGVEVLDYDCVGALADAGHAAVFSPGDLAPAAARLVLEPGREALWDWPDMPGELFFTRRLVYS